MLYNVYQGLCLYGNPFDREVEVDRWRGYLQVRDAARYLGISSGTLRNWERAGKIPGYRHPANNYRLFRRGDLDMMLRQIEESRSDSTHHHSDRDQDDGVGVEEAIR